MVFCTRKKLSYSCFEPDIIKSVPANTQYRVIHKTERMVESLSNCTLQEDKSKREFQILETLTQELVEPNSVTKEGLNLRNRNRYQNIIPYDKNIVRLNKKIGKRKLLLRIWLTFLIQEFLHLITWMPLLSDLEAFARCSLPARHLYRTIFPPSGSWWQNRRLQWLWWSPSWWRTTRRRLTSTGQALVL